MLADRIERDTSCRLRFHVPTPAKPQLGSFRLVPPQSAEANAQEFAIIREGDHRFDYRHMDVIEAVVEACQVALWQSRPLEVTIDSRGGYAEHAFTIAEHLAHVAEYGKVQVVTRRSCMSGALIILTSVPLKARYAVRNTQFVMHAARDLGQRTQKTRAFDLKMIHHFSEATGLRQTDLAEIMRTGLDYGFNAKAALSHGLVGHIV